MNNMEKLHSQYSDMYCGQCKRRQTKWDIRCCRALGKPWTCENCLAKQFDKTVDEFNEFMNAHFNMYVCLGMPTKKCN